MYLGTADATAPNGDEPLGLQDPQRFTHRRIADAELAHEVVLGGQLIHGRLGQDAFSQCGGHGFRNTPPRI